MTPRGLLLAFPLGKSSKGVALLPQRKSNWSSSGAQKSREVLSKEGVKPITIVFQGHGAPVEFSQSLAACRSPRAVPAQPGLPPGASAPFSLSHHSQEGHQGYSPVEADPWNPAVLNPGTILPPCPFQAFAEVGGSLKAMGYTEQSFREGSRLLCFSSKSSAHKLDFPTGTFAS